MTALFVSALVLGGTLHPAAPAIEGHDRFSPRSNLLGAAPPDGLRGVEPPPSCAAGSLFAQTPDTPEDFLAMTSEASAGFLRSENFDGVAGPVVALRWWGLDLRPVGPNAWQECAETDTTFDITFYRDAGGVPGSVECTYTLVVTRTPLPDLYLGAQLNQYDVTLPTPCIMVRGWVSIVGLGDPSCWFLWMSAGPGESYCDGCSFPDEGWDASICMIGEPGGVLGACCNDTTQQCQDGVEMNFCTAANQRFAPNQACAELDPPCGVILGACCRQDATCDVITQAECQATGGLWLGADTTCAQCPCAVPCPAGSTPEGEPICVDNYVDHFNGGCNSGASGFSPISIGEVVCATSGVYIAAGGATPDFDWYELNLQQVRTIQWKVGPELPMQIWILSDEGGCSWSIVNTTFGDACDTLTLNATVGAGTYWLVTAPTQFSDESACGAEYVAALRAVSLCPGDVDDDGHVTLDDLLLVLGNFGHTGLAPVGDLDLDGDVDLDDLLFVLGNFGADCT